MMDKIKITVLNYLKNKLFYLFLVFIIFIMAILLFIKKTEIILVLFFSCLLGIIIYFYIKEKNEKDNLVKEINELKKENLKVKSTTINFQSIKTIFEVHLHKATASIYRIMDEEIEVEKKKVRYFGALRMEILAKYGIDLKSVKLMVDKQNRIIKIKGVVPRLLMWKDNKKEWKIDNIVEEEKFLIIKTNKWKTNPELYKILMEKKEKFENDLKEEINSRGIEEFEFLMPLLKKEIEEMIKNIFVNFNYKVEICNEIDQGILIDYEEFINEPQKYLNP